VGGRSKIIRGLRLILFGIRRKFPEHADQPVADKRAYP